jgi:hypothetical protein
MCGILDAPLSYIEGAQPSFHPAPMSAFLSLSITVFIALLLAKYVTSRKQHRPYPPGPKPMPIIGNAFELPTIDAAEVYTAWGKKYNSELNVKRLVLSLC